MLHLFLCTRADPYPVSGAALTLILPVIQRSQRQPNLYHTKQPYNKVSPTAAALQERCHRRGLLLGGSSSSTYLRTIWQVCPLEVTATLATDASASFVSSCIIAACH